MQKKKIIRVKVLKNFVINSRKVHSIISQKKTVYIKPGVTGGKRNEEKKLSNDLKI